MNRSIRLSLSLALAAGGVASVSAQSLTGTDVWMWTGTQTLRHTPGTTTAAPITKVGGAALAATRIIQARDTTRATLSSVWFMASDGVYLHNTGATTASLVTFGGSATTSPLNLTAADDFTSPTGSQVWWNTNARVLRHIPGTTTAEAITQAGGTNILNVIGIFAACDRSSPTGSSVWAWNGGSLFRNVPGTATMQPHSAVGGGPLGTVSQMLESPDTGHASGVQLFMRNSTGAVYRHLAGTTTWQGISGIGSAIGFAAGKDTLSVTGGQAFFWRTNPIFSGTALYRWNPGTNTAAAVNDSSGNGVRDVQEVVIAPDSSRANGAVAVIRTTSDVFIHNPSTGAAQRVSLPPSLGESPRGVAVVFDGEAPGCARVWIWTSNNLYILRHGTLNVDVVAAPGGGGLSNITSVTSKLDATSPAGGRIFIRNTAGWFVHNPGTFTTSAVTDGGSAISGTMQLASRDLSANATKGNVWAWNSSRVYLNNPASPTTATQITLSGASIGSVAGLIETLSAGANAAATDRNANLIPDGAECLAGAYVLGSGAMLNTDTLTISPTSGVAGVPVRTRVESTPNGDVAVFSFPNLRITGPVSAFEPT